MSDCVFDSWSPTIGDPTVVGWLTVALYATAAYACYRASNVRRRDGWFWFVMFLMMVALCVNKQLDLQSALTAIGRCMAKHQGWYADRRSVQATFIAVLLLVSTFAAMATLLLMWSHLKRIGVAVVGFVLLLTFVAVRAVGFHHFDHMLGTDVIFGIRFNWLMEISGILLILANAIFAIRGARPRHALAIDHSS